MGLCRGRGGGGGEVGGGSRGGSRGGGEMVMVCLHFMVVIEKGVELFMIVVIHSNENWPISGVSVAVKGRVFGCLCQRPQMEEYYIQEKDNRGLTVGRSRGRVGLF